MSLTPRERILKERGMVKTRPSSKKRSKVVPIIKPPVSGINKTPMMRYLEEKYGQPIEEVLISGSLTIIVKRLNGEVDRSTVSRWIKRLKLRYTPENLPNCHGCKEYRPACDLGLCYVLLNLELWELVPLKKEEILG